MTPSPRCPRCRGRLIPERNIDNVVVAVSCANCGEYLARDFRRRAPTAADLWGATEPQKKGRSSSPYCNRYVA